VRLTITAVIWASSEQARTRFSSTLTPEQRGFGEAVQHRTPARAASRVPAALLAVLALALDPLVGAHAFAAAEAPDAVMLADAGAPAAILLADAGARHRAGRMEGATGAQQRAGVRPTDSPHTGQAEARHG
jgi:hypothetical protein